MNNEQINSKLLACAIKNSNVCITITDMQNNITYVNNAALHMHGYEATDILGKPVSILHSPNNPPGLGKKIISDTYNGGWHGELLNIKKDGSEFPISLSTSVIRDDAGNPLALMGVAQEVTSQKAAVMALRASEERYRALYEDNPSMYFTLNQHAMVMSVNQFGASQLGYTPDELVGKSVLKVLYEKDKPAVLEQFDICLKNPEQVAHWEFRKVRKDGSIMWVEEHARAVRQPDGEWNVLIVCEDITERKKAEEERQRLELQVQHTQKLESLGVLAGGIAHDFNNLLTGILGNIEFVCKSLPPASPTGKYIEGIKNASLRAAELCKQLLAYSGRGSFDIHPVGLNTLIEDMVHLLDVSIFKKIDFRYYLSEHQPVVEGDAVQLSQVIMNLITNASEAIGDATGEITIHTNIIECSISDLQQNYVSYDASEGTYCSIKVTDTGCGMNAETQSRIFDPFFTTKFTGRGLGLAAVLGIVKGHKGAIRIQSEPGQGTVFELLFPFSDKPEAILANTPDSGQDVTGSGTVLVIDDEELVRNLARDTLESIGLNVITAEDGVEGIDIFSKHKKDILLVLLDMTMPRLSGAETFKKLRHIRKDIPVVLCSGFNEQDAVSNFDSRELAGFIQKPFTLHEFIDKIQTVMAEAH